MDLAACSDSYPSRSLSQKAVWCLGDDAFACQLSASIVYNEVTSRELDLHPVAKAQSCADPGIDLGVSLLPLLSAMKLKWIEL